MKEKKKNYKKIALALSVCLLVIWGLLGAGASLAWFSDTSAEVENVFNIAEFELEVSYRTEDGTYETIDGKTDIFDDEALYEPGYVQVVYMKVDNLGTVPFDYTTAVIVKNYRLGTNVFGQSFSLQDYLRFGIVTAQTEYNLQQKLADRELARKIADMPLNNYSTEKASLDAKETIYMALVIYMPEEVGNVANYRGVQPSIELGISVKATQKE